MPMIDKFLFHFLPARHPQFFSPLATGQTGVIYDSGYTQAEVSHPPATNKQIPVTHLAAGDAR